MAYKLHHSLKLYPHPKDMNKVESGAHGNPGYQHKKSWTYTLVTHAFCFCSCGQSGASPEIGSDIAVARTLKGSGMITCNRLVQPCEYYNAVVGDSTEDSSNSHQPPGGFVEWCTLLQAPVRDC